MSAMQAQDPAEQFIYDICRNSFFSLWSYLNPKREDGKELCDILVSFGNDLILISVKNIPLHHRSLDHTLANNRWLRKAVRKSESQLVGAERHLRKKGRFSVAATSTGEKLTIDNIHALRIHRISVSLGSGGKVPLSSGKSKDHFVHVLTEPGFLTLTRELDTISDFVRYLRSKEDFLCGLAGSVICHGEEDLLSVYLLNDRQFPDWSGYKATLIEQGDYAALMTDPKFIAKKREDGISYLVDEIIGEFVRHADGGTLIFRSDLTGLEKSLARLASEDRLGRRLLGQSIHDVVTSSSAAGITSRTLFIEQTQTLYVIVAAPQEMTRQDRRELLGARCHIAIGRFRDMLDKLEVVGIATEVPDVGKGRSYDLCYEFLQEWTPDAQAEMDRFVKVIGITKEPEWKHFEAWEYPDAEQ